MQTSNLALNLNVIQQGLRIVASDCDGANRQDGVGFSKMDGHLGRELIRKPIENWSIFEVKKACLLFQKYKKQHQLNIDKTELAEYIYTLTIHGRNISFEGANAVIEFIYDKELVATIKELGFCKWDSINSKWTAKNLTETNLQTLLNFGYKNKFNFEGNCEPISNETKIYKGKLSLEGKKICIVFEFSRLALETLKNIDVAKKWDANKKAWFINTNDLNNKIIAELESFVTQYELAYNNELKEFIGKEEVKVESQDNLLVELKAKYNFAFQYQLETVKYVLNTKKVYIGSEMGCGKAQSLDSNILTPNGFISMKNIEIGSEVINELGQVSKVIGVYPQGLKDMYRVTFSDGSQTECCDEHLWNIQTATMKYRNPTNFYTKQLKDFKNKLYDINNNKKCFIPMVKAVEFAKKPFIIHPYILGVILGDGGISGHCICITKQDQDLFTNIEQYLPEYMYLKTINEITKRLNSKPRLNPFVAELKRLNLMGNKSNTKFIPKEYLLGSIEQRTALLQGLLDTDGFVDKRGMVLQFSSTSKQLALDTQFIIQSLGGVASMSEKTGSYIKDGIKKICEICYTLTISLPPEIIPLQLPRKLNRYIPKTKYPPHRAFAKVEYIGKKEAQCIMIDSPTHLYVTDNFIVTHNTLITLLSIDSSNALPALIICPNSLKYNWSNEVKKFIGNRTSYVITSKDKELPKADIYIINYDICVKKLDLLKTIPFQFIACDEAHLIKSPKAQRTKAITELINEVNPKFRILLSGTCITNRPNELVSQLKVLGTLNKIVSKDWDFYLRYCNAYRTKFGWDLTGASNTQELSQKMRANFYIRHEKKDVLGQLPDLMRSNVYLEIDNRKEYNKALHDIIEYLAEVREKEVSISAEHLVQIETLKQLTAKGKLQAVKEWVQNFLANDEKLVLFAHHKQMISDLKGFFPEALVIDGSTSAEDRQKAVDKFQNDIDCKLIILSLKAGSVGLTLTASSNVAFTELSWTPAELDQSEARCILEGQKVLTNQGYKNIENIVIGDMVYTHKGEFKEVINTSKKTERTKLFIDIKYKGFYENLSVTEDHKIYVYNKNTQIYSWVEARNLNPNTDFLVFPKLNYSPSNIINIDVIDPYSDTFINTFGSVQTIHNKHKLANSVELTNDLCFAFGYYIANGCSIISDGKRSSKVSVAGNSEGKLDITRFVIQTISKAFNNLPINEYFDKNSKGIEFSVYSKVLAYNMLNWFGEGAINKQFPSWVYDLSKDKQRSFLDGYYAGDGYIRKNTQQATSISEKLIHQLCILEASFNKPITVRHNEYAKAWSFEYSEPNKIKRDALIKTNDACVLFPISEMRIYKPRRNKQKVYDLTVKDNHSFVVGLASVHNCHRIGSKSTVTAHYLLGKDTIEDTKIMPLIEKKRAIFDAVARGQEVAKKDLQMNIMSEFVDSLLKDKK